MTTDDVRLGKLRRFLMNVAQGSKTIVRREDAILLLGCVVAQPDAVHCITRILTESTLLSALKQSLRIDLSPDFLNRYVASFINYISREELRSVNGGRVLLDLELAITDTPYLWDAFKSAAASSSLSAECLESYGKLLLDLLSLLPPTNEAFARMDVAEAARAAAPAMINCNVSTVRLVGYKVQEALKRHASAPNGAALGVESLAGGRHDNDFSDFRKIAIFPTTDELISQDQPFLQTAESMMRLPPGERVAAHLDNQFRLLREDFMKELRDDLEVSIGRPHHRNKRRPILKLCNLQFSGIVTGVARARGSAGLARSHLHAPTFAFRCWDPMFRKLPNDSEERKRHFAHDKTLRHGALGCLVHQAQVICFATVERNENLLAQKPSVILLHVFGSSAVRKVLRMVKIAPVHEIELVMVDTPFFAYEPVLHALQQMPSIALAEQLFDLDEAGNAAQSSLKLESVASQIEDSAGHDLESVLCLPKPVRLDNAQTTSIVAGLTQAVSLIQGPPGTGKSFLGALLTKAFVDRTRETILVLCYTNHALDQFLEDIMDIGVPTTYMVRLGGKFTSRTQPLLLNEQTRSFRAPQTSWQLRNYHAGETESAARNLEDAGFEFRNWRSSDATVLANLEFDDDDSLFFHALSVPESKDGMTIVDERGRPVRDTYLFERWRQGQNAGIFRNTVEVDHPEVWKTEHNRRQELWEKWTRQAVSEKADTLSTEIADCDEKYQRWTQYRDDRSLQLVKSKRIIGCTTTAAAKYNRLISGACPGIVVVEEAGEVLESHVLTALGGQAKQLVLIGDHLQLRPKVANHELSVEKGEGFDLNRSLFERLVLSGYRHTVLTKQHRMRPEVSTLVRKLMYPELEDSETTKDRDNIRGLQSNVVFINHDKLEEFHGGSQPMSDGYKQSRRNVHEARMVLSIVRYLAQQGYGTDRQVVLTPYLGQLRQLMDQLRNEHDPVLNDLDSHDLVKAGLLDRAGANVKNRSLRISTVDNYQGEESSIVIVSLTRSNENGDIGFLSEAQRLNVLLSRARDGLIIIGNAATFRMSKKGREVWEPFFEQLSEAGHFFQGLPVRCERHPQTQHVLQTPEDFDRLTPNGGCMEPCLATLNCKKHRCPDKCHQLVDHSKVRCEEVIPFQCSAKHQYKRRCFEKSSPCPRCQREEEARKVREERDYRLAKKREEAERAYLNQLLDLDEEIAEQKRRIKELDEAKDRTKDLEQKQKELAAAKVQAEKAEKDAKNRAATQAQGTATDTTNGSVQLDPSPPSEAKDDWNQQKVLDGAQNQHIDELMNMIGLESVKRQVLDVKDKIDTALRQGTDLTGERFGTLLLGNPGTGKTTVARLYANCLASMGVVSGTAVKETTASKLMNGGVQAFSKMVDEILNQEGGTIFIDEAYQLAAPHGGASGKQILDALLDAAELQRGKIVFFLAGYRKEMEDVIAHNPGLPSRFPHEFVFEDYTDPQLLAIFEQKVHKQWRGRMKLADGFGGLYARIVARRVGYGRDHPGFGNARAMENSFDKIKGRQAARLAKERRKGIKFDDFFISVEDMIGPEPSIALKNCRAWVKLGKLVGLGDVKDATKALLLSLTYNYQRELKEEPLLQFNLNRVFLGSPGTGKTTIAKIYGEIFRDLGLLSNGEVIVKNPSDFVGDVIGGSEKNTKGILAATVGKVLVIDEAYSLYSGTGASGQQVDPYRSAVIDTIVAEVQSVPGDDRCVLLLGYRPQMEKMFQNVNPGLSRRFPLAEAFEFADFSDDELKEVVKMKLKQQGYNTGLDGMQAIMECLGRARNKVNFGNAGEVDILLNASKARHMQRLGKGAPGNLNATLDPSDIDPEFDRAKKAKLGIRELFQDTVGAEDVIQRMEQIQKLANNAKMMDLDPRKYTPFNFRFVGPPGTGKTTTARKMGELYYDIGILATKDVVEISVTDLVGEYVGHTGPKTEKALEQALGKVLFIDEAYRLADGQFAKQAVDEIVDLITKPKFFQKLIIVLAGYDRDIERLMTINPGLSSRFPETIRFPALSAADCWSLMRQRLQQETFLLCRQLGTLDPKNESIILSHLQTLINGIPGASWANARDVGTLAKTVANSCLENANPTNNLGIDVGPKDVIRVLKKAVDTRRSLGALSIASATDDRLRQLRPPSPPVMADENIPDPPATNTATSASVADMHEESDDEILASPSQDTASDARDAGVTDEVWQQLEADKQRLVQEEQAYQDLLERQKELEAAAEKDKAAETDDEWMQVDGGKGESSDSDGDDERQKQEQERIARERLGRQREAQLEKIRIERIEKERERQREMEAQRKLRKMGVCVMGYRWIKQASGYRCAGGFHFVSDAEIQAAG